MSDLHKGWQLRLAGVLVSLGLLGGAMEVVYSLDTNQGAETSQSGQDLNSANLQGSLYEVTIDTSEINLACAPGFFDPEDDSQSQSVAWVSTGIAAQELSGGGFAVEPGEITSAEDFPFALSADGDPKSEWYSTLVNNCQIPENQLALAAGATIVGEDSLLILSNPNSTSVEVNIKGFGATGQLSVTSQVIVPERSTVTWRPAVLFGNEDRLGLLLEADGQGVAAWLQSSGRDGEVSTGVGRLSATSLRQENVISGVSESGGIPVLNLFNPSEEPAEVTISISDGKGITALGGAEELVVDAGTVFQISLAGIGQEPVSVVVDSDQQLSAAVVQLIEGQADTVVSGQQTFSRNLVSPGQSSTEFVVPTAEVDQIVTDLGYSKVETKVVLFNPSDEPVDVSVGSKTNTVAAYTTVPIVIDDTEEIRLDSTSPVIVSLVLSGETSSGPVSSVVDLGTGGVESVRTQVFVGP